MKKNLWSGLALLLPLAVTIFVFVFLINFLTKPFLAYFTELIRFFGDGYIDFDKHSTSLLVISKILILITLFFAIILLGFLGNKIFFHYLMKTIHKWMMKIPLINKVYKVVKDIITAILSDEKKVFSRVVSLPFPNEHSKTIGLVTGETPFTEEGKDNSNKDCKEKLKSVLIATSPHPLSGFLLLVKEKHLNRIDFTVEDAFKYLVSCGVYKPEREE